jgi:putative tricarboxylic transport membrane protein
LRHSDLQSGVLFLLLSVLISIESLRIGIGEWHAPGPGFIPFWAGVILGGLSFLLLLTAYFHRSADLKRGWTKEVLWGRWSFTLISIVVYTLFLEILGFILSTFILINVLILALKPRFWKTALIVATVATGSSYLIFQVWLKAQLPRGFFGF